ncbi:hypothetical protein N7468_003035 [Penicillium chermesinum]|uniref:Uncharacterized protein n=1 Tax=Penicillium chermesinum TaxID=63820 RepID=A0A9W9TR83_9EURO|nr:uncharacterized protein N7468_003035 [Penicillium chermesinum]KAJ5238416.1 hypothetical protein N7468_003035 [Penicillium chermesinum]KAJ6164078.1 hypothetical protein N7470_002750 [Penicillium chermesinum]
MPFMNVGSARAGFFIDFERTDKQKCDTATEGCSARTILRASDYQRYQEETGAIPAGLRGGLYQRVFLDQHRTPTADIFAISTPKT